MFTQVVGFGISIVVALVVTQDTPTPPPTTQQTQPPDPKNCKLNAYSPYGFVVKIWNKTAGKATGHGSLISPMAILTTATNHDWRELNVSEYQAVGQNIWNTNTWESCMQVRTINSSLVHDKCCNPPETSKFFNFMVFVLDQPFDVSTSSVDETGTCVVAYPLIYEPLEPLRLLAALTDLNRGKSNIKCSVPLLTGLKEMKPSVIREKDMEMVGLNYNETCVNLMCEEGFREASNGITFEECQDEYFHIKHDTMMCLEPKAKNQKLEVPPNTKRTTEFYGGAAVLCDTSPYGIVTEVFVRDPPLEHPGHFFYVVTFLRAYYWLLKQQQLHTNKQAGIPVESWGIPPKYRSSEPTPVFFVETTTTQQPHHSFSPFLRSHWDILAFMLSVNFVHHLRFIQ